MKKKSKKILLQSFAVLIALSVITVGVGPLFLKDALFYKNVWGGLVFAPFTVAVGLLLLYIIIFKWDKMSEIDRPKKRRRR
jgi:hypothetical protein